MVSENKYVKELAGKVQTVLGLIDPEDLGITLPHEHLLIDQTCGGVYFTEPEEASQKIMAHQPVTLANLSWVRYHMIDSLDNRRLLDESMAIKEAMLFKLQGGKTIVDQTNIGIGRDPGALARISRATGLNIVMGSGYYIDGSYPKEAMEAKNEEQVANEIIQDVIAGVGGTGICSGIIGELGCSWPLRTSEIKVLRAGAMAQSETGCALIVHPGRNEESPIETIKVLDNAGADLRRVVMSHMCRSGFLLDTRRKVLESGGYIAYDNFGLEGYYPIRLAAAEDHLPDLRNDVQRIKEIKELIDMGYLNQILISQDIGMKITTVSYGGGGYAHILRDAVPYMKAYGITDAQIDTLMVENPKRLLTIT
jgi:phosphotriesterase-related protein